MNALVPLRPAALDLSFVRRGDRTVLERRLFAWPFVLTRTFLLDPVPAHMRTVIIQTSSSALHGEDRLTQRIHLGRGAAAHLTTQGASPVHRAHPGMIAREAVDIVVEPEAFLEYLPEPRILFPGAALDQTIDIDCAPGATLIVSDAFTVHDPGRNGHGFRQLASTVTLRFEGGAPAMIDRLDIAHLGRGRFARYTAFSSIFMVAPLPVEILEQLALDLSAALAAIPGLYGAASLLPGNIGVGVRLAAEDLRAVRAGRELSWIAFRRLLCGEAPASRRTGDDLRLHRVE
ncbi:MAG: putative urease accessory protein ureD [Devosia sp.]|uniref:urease accessory protein UreD n=1 Tax=Devosia sp. TaxID=1871048 RepID=UPI00260BB463|nr:urease accessory protein UreD [Devosia sp.]MDB5529902.1 putative urease accessory protein ureD [Devosia sp.]